MLVNNIKAALVANFNRANKLKPSLALDEVIWLNNEIWLQGECNSRVTILANANSYNYENRRTIYYVRRDIAVDLKGIKIPGKRSDYNGLKSVIRALHDKCGVPLDETTFVEEALPATGPVTIKPTTQCMAYLPTGTVKLDFAE